jgi:cyclic beta-1,2-glucan synthetase
MAHHQGMSLLALAYLLLDRPMQRRFESDRLFQAVMLLLQERIPEGRRPVFAHRQPLRCARASIAAAMPIRVFSSPDTPTPEVQLLSNGRYHVMVSNAGGGYSRWKDLAVTRWREDGTCDHWGSFLLRPRAGGRGEWRVLVDRPSADAQTARDVRSDLLRGARRVSPPRCRSQRLRGDRNVYRDRRLAGG